MSCAQERWRRDTARGCARTVDARSRTPRAHQPWAASLLSHLLLLGQQARRDAVKADGDAGVPAGRWPS